MQGFEYIFFTVIVIFSAKSQDYPYFATPKYSYPTGVFSTPVYSAWLTPILNTQVYSRHLLGGSLIFSLDYSYFRYTKILITNSRFQRLSIPHGLRLS